MYEGFQALNLSLLSMILENQNIKNIIAAYRSFVNPQIRNCDIKKNTPG
jgi:hypothetical protein